MEVLQGLAQHLSIGCNLFLAGMVMRIARRQHVSGGEYVFVYHLLLLFCLLLVKQQLVGQILFELVSLGHFGFGLCQFACACARLWHVLILQINLDLLHGSISLNRLFLGLRLRLLLCCGCRLGQILGSKRISLVLCSVICQFQRRKSDIVLIIFCSCLFGLLALLCGLLIKLDQLTRFGINAIAVILVILVAFTFLILLGGHGNGDLFFNLVLVVLFLIILVLVLVILLCGNTCTLRTLCICRLELEPDLMRCDLEQHKEQNDQYKQQNEGGCDLERP